MSPPGVMVATQHRVKMRQTLHFTEMKGRKGLYLRLALECGLTMLQRRLHPFRQCLPSPAVPFPPLLGCEGHFFTISHLSCPTKEIKGSCAWQWEHNKRNVIWY
eukprot:TRINITY_DN2704_c0_g1_i1.p1 TRINITY_DN2704_c0_g1~~TRINITY_DN2704_c0_g1_i1.p1  ORF type:complete len:104 (+),score=10.17 TRINITY_DN2704_c0_g1_i1:84-395(+)